MVFPVYLVRLDAGQAADPLRELVPKRGAFAGDAFKALKLGCATAACGSLMR